MRLVKLLILLASFSFIGSCSNAPDVEVCVSDPPSMGYQCSFKGKKRLLRFEDSSNYTCLSPDHLDLITSYLKRELERKCK